MNSGPTGSVIASLRMRSILAALQRRATSRHTERSLHLVGVAGAPERHADALVEHPAYRQVNHASVEEISRELIELPNGCQVLR